MTQDQQAAVKVALHVLAVYHVSGSTLDKREIARYLPPSDSPTPDLFAQATQVLTDAIGRTGTFANGVSA